METILGRTALISNLSIPVPINLIKHSKYRSSDLSELTYTSKYGTLLSLHTLGAAETSVSDINCTSVQ
jgi:hypothetical protein